MKTILRYGKSSLLFENMSKPSVAIEAKMSGSNFTWLDNSSFLNIPHRKYDTMENKKNVKICIRGKAMKKRNIVLIISCVAACGIALLMIFRGYYTWSENTFSNLMFENQEAYAQSQRAY